MVDPDDSRTPFETYNPYHGQLSLKDSSSNLLQVNLQKINKHTSAHIYEEPKLAEKSNNQRTSRNLL
jgi:hypothetical protein